MPQPGVALEKLGFDSAWVRHRHLQYGISSPVAVLAAASQRRRPAQPGVSVGPPAHFDDVRGSLYPGTAAAEDFSYERVARLLRLAAGEPAASFRGTEGFEQFSDRVQPHSPGLRDRMWYGGASLASARWADPNGMNFLTSSVVRAEESEDFAAVQLSHIRAFRAAHPRGEAARVSQGLGPALGWRPKAA